MPHSSVVPSSRQRETATSFQRLEAWMTWRRKVVQETIGAEVIGEVDFGEQIAVEIDGCETKQRFAAAVRLRSAKTAAK